MTVVDQPVQQGICHRGVAYHVVPFFNRELAYHDGTVSIRNINAMYYPLCQLYLRPVARVSNGYFSGISEVVVIKIDAI